MGSPIRVLVVDDSPTMQALLKYQFEQDPGFEVVGMAANPLAAREAIKATDPDVLTLDIQMPGMDGLAFLERLMKLRPMPVVVVSSLVSKNSEVELDALALGAFDCFQKPKTAMDADGFADLRNMVRAAASMPAGKAPGADADATSKTTYRPGNVIVAVGASTGGVDALLSIMDSYPQNCPPTVITQHMPKSFTQSFAERLDARCAARVTEASNGAELKPGYVYLAPGGDTHLEVNGRTKPMCRLRAGPPVSGHRPSVDALFLSLARRSNKAVGVILTGMGEDGAKGLLEMRKAGCRTIGQDRDSSLVYGMPRVAQEIGAVEEQMSIGRIGKRILALTAKGNSK